MLFIAFASGFALSSHLADPDLTTRVLSRAESKAIRDDWGRMDIYTGGNTSTYGTRNMFTALTDVRPGTAVHPAHRHGEEEFLLIASGSGIWNVEGEQFTASRGDLLYAEPWKMHGLYNDTDSTLTFFVIKWQSKGVPIPEEPEGDHGR